MRARIAVHAAAGIGRDLPDLDDARAEPAHRCGLHGIGEPAIERRNDRTGQRRRRLHRDRPECRNGVALCRPKPRKNRLRPAGGGIGAFRIGRGIAVTRRIGLRTHKGRPGSRLRQPWRALEQQIDFILLGRNAGGRQRNRATGHRAIAGLSHRLRRNLRRRLRDRPARLIADASGRPDYFIRKAERSAAFAERGDLKRILGAANPGARNRTDPHQLCVFFHRAGLQARDFGLGPPRFALRG